ncbi:MAG: TonB-dependent receptor [Flavobacteriales bacterium]|nr:TonB-dependent receptor [Flavobacteriales bacterium]
MKTIFTFAFFTLISLISQAQESPTSAIRGRVLDGQSEYPLPGATILITSLDPVKGTATDLDGQFIIEGIPVGRHSVQISFIGYEPQTLNNLLLNSGKDLEVNVKLLESVTVLKEIEIVARDNKSEAQNEMSSVSTRSFSIDEAMRYSGTLQDPSRMAQNYAGVSNASDDRNDIIIRGNSPTGVLWRMEGIDIPSPNHFATLGTTGGPISLLNINNLGNSDFSTSAFAAEYGNALSGVFDLKLRSGNKNKREYMAQMGFNGLEFGAEGPFKQGGQATFIVNGRYSYLGLLTGLGVDFGTGAAVPEYQDITFKVDLPTAKAGRFSLFGIGGNSFIDFKAEDAGENNLYSSDRENSVFKSQTGIIGLSHTYFFSPKTMGKLVLAATTGGTQGYVDTLSLSSIATKTFGIYQRQSNMTAHYSLNTKLNAKHTLKFGIMTDNYGFDITDSVLVDGDYYFTRNNFDGNASLARAYGMWNYRPTDNWTINTGVYGQHFFYNETSIIEPRVGARYAINNRQSLSFGLGAHSQLQPITVYFNREETDEGVVSNNKNLDFNKALHAVIGYDFQFSETLRLKSEIYYQHLYDIAVDRFSSSFSMLNTGADFTLPENADLVNEGTGTNMGIELTLEKFLSKGYYFLFTTSLFDSQYDGSDGVSRNTAFNGNYVFNLLAGKEWKVGKSNTITLDFKTTYAGGRWYAPIDLEASRLEGGEVRLTSNNNSAQYDAYFRTDFKIGFRKNGAKVSQAFSLDIRNVTNQQNVFLQNYDSSSGEVETVYQTGFFPIFLYNIYF